MPDKQQRQRSITFDSLRVHASKLDLEQKVQLVQELKEQIKSAVEAVQKQAASAVDLTKTL